MLIHLDFLHPISLPLPLRRLSDPYLASHCCRLPWFQRYTFSRLFLTKAEQEELARKAKARRKEKARQEALVCYPAIKMNDSFRY